MKGILPFLTLSAVFMFMTTAASAGERLFAVVYPVINPFFEATSIGAEKEAERLGVEVMITGPDRFDVQQQIEIVKRLIAAPVSGFGIGPVDTKALTPILDQAIDHGIKVVTFDTDAPESRRLAYIGTDNQKAGEHLGQVLGKALGGRGKVLVSTGIPSQLNLRQRLEGVEKALRTDFPEVRIVDVRFGRGDADLTLANVEAMVRTHPDFNALIGIDSFAGPAIVTVWKAMGLKQVAITFDDLPQVIAGVKNGQIYASIVQRQYDWGVEVVRQLNQACNGESIPANTDTGTLEITKSNVLEFYPD